MSRFQFHPKLLPGLALAALCIWGPGLRVHAHGDYHDVVKEIDQALQKEPDNADLHFRLAVACEEHGEWTSALIALERAERLAPGKHPIGLIQGKALAQGTQWQAAETVLSEFLGTHFENAEAWAERARVRLQLSRPQEAITDFQTAITKAERPTADLFLETANAWFTQANLEEANQVLNHGIERLGSIPELLEKAIEIETRLERYDQAITHLETLRTVAAQPELWQARQARLLSQAGRQEAATTVWQDLRTRILAMPSLQRGQPDLTRLLQEAQAALGETSVVPAVVIAPPASPVSPVSLTPAVSRP